MTTDTITAPDLAHHVERVVAGEDGVRKAFTWKGGQRAQLSPLSVATLKRLAIERGVPAPGSDLPGEWRDDDAGRVIMVPFTDESLDSYDTVFDADGWDFRAYDANPVVFFSHEQRQIPVGLTLRIDKAWLRGADGVRRRGYAAHMLLSREDLEPAAEAVFRNWMAGRLRGSSVGFRPVSWRQAEPADRKRYGLPADADLERILIFTRAQLNEISIVPIPANSSTAVRADEARRLARSGAMLRDDVAQLLGDDAVADLPAEEWADERVDLSPSIMLTGDDDAATLEQRQAEVERRLAALEAEVEGIQAVNRGPVAADDGGDDTGAVDLYHDLLALRAKTTTAAIEAATTRR